MENTNKRTLTLLSSFQIAISVLFFVLGLVDKLEIRYLYVSLAASPCWIIPLTLANGIMGLVLSQSRKRSSNLIHAIWSVSVACIIYSAITVLRYQTWGVEWLMNNIITDTSGIFRTEKWWFVKKNVQLKYTEQENKAFAVFGIIIVFSMIEIILAAALAKVSDSSHKVAQQPVIPMYYGMYYQPVGQVSGFPGQTSADTGSGARLISAQDMQPAHNNISPH